MFRLLLVNSIMFIGSMVLTGKDLQLKGASFSKTLTKDLP